MTVREVLQHNRLNRDLFHNTSTNRAGPKKHCKLQLQIFEGTIALHCILVHLKSSIQFKLASWYRPLSLD